MIIIILIIYMKYENAKYLRKNCEYSQKIYTSDGLI